MEYRVLTPDTVVDYVRSIDALNDHLGPGELEVAEIGDGNLNYVYIIKSGDKSVILKQAVPYLRCAGEEWPLSRERMNYEIRALETFKEIASDNVPHVYHADEAMSVVVMEYLDDHIIMRKGLIEGETYPNFAEHITDYLAGSLFATSSLNLKSEDKRKLMQRFNTNTELCKITEDFVFTFPYMEHDSNNINPLMQEEHRQLMHDGTFKMGMLKLKYIFMNQSDALLHGDLHTGSIMLNEAETYVIDPEFAFFGPFGFDIGAVVANLIQSYVSHFARSRDPLYQEWILQTVYDVLTKFEAKFLTLWNEAGDNALVIEGFVDEGLLDAYKRDFMRNILRQSIGFAGAKMARRLFGIAGVEDILGIEDPEARMLVEMRSLSIAKAFVKNYETIESVDDVISMIRSGR